MEENEKEDKKRMREFFKTRKYAGEIKDWKDMPELAVSEDESEEETSRKP